MQRTFIESLVNERSLNIGLADVLDLWQRTVDSYFRERDGTEFHLTRDGSHRNIELVVGRTIEKLV